MNWDKESMKVYVKDALSEKRFNHVMGVVKTAEDLAARHGVSVEDASIAALLHDVAKERTNAELEALLKAHNETDTLKYSFKTWHATVGAIMAKETFGIYNEDIQNAIRFHTTGRANMSALEKVLFVADFTEPNRTFIDCVNARNYWDDLDRATFAALESKVNKLNKAGATIHPDTLAGYEYYKNKVAQ